MVNSMCSLFDEPGREMLFESHSPVKRTSILSRQHAATSRTIASVASGDTMQCHTRNFWHILSIDYYGSSKRA
jgi:hypothetical protein